MAAFHVSSVAMVCERAVGVLDVQLGAETRIRAVVVADVHPADVAAVPAVGQDAAEGVGALLDAVGDVEGVVVDPLVVVGPAGGEVGVAHLPAVEVQLVVAQRGGVDGRPLDRLVQDELLAEELRRRQEQLARGDVDLAPGVDAVGAEDLDGLPAARRRNRRSSSRRRRTPKCATCRPRRSSSDSPSAN